MRPGEGGRLDPGDESYLSSLSMLGAWHQEGACAYCDTDDAELVALADGRTGLAVAHRPYCPYAEGAVGR